jgi:hypothetical protein
MVTDNELIQDIYKVAGKLKGSPLTHSEKQEIIKQFNEIKNLPAFERAKKAIEQTIGKELPEEIFLEFLGGSINSLNDLLIKLQSTASQWKKVKK